MMPPKFTYADIKYSTSRSIVDKAVELFKSGCVGPISEGPHEYSAIVQGTEPYRVSMSQNRIDDSDCTCYMGRNDQLCKHVLALALEVLEKSGVQEDTRSPQSPTDLVEAKEIVRDGMKRIKPYRGPSKIWFRYQRDLSVGCGMIEDAVAALPPIKENAKYIWSLVKRLDKKLLNGIDDSDGTVGGCVSGLIEQLAAHAEENPELISMIEQFCSEGTSYDFHVMLEGMIDELRER